jgi:hypothetical protein
MRASFFLLLPLLLALVAAAELPTFTLRERLHRTWLPQLVHFDVEGLPQGALQPAQTVVLDDAGARHACQWSGATLYPDGSVKAGAVWFLTDLPADSTKTFRLAAGQAITPPLWGAKVDGATLDGGSIAIKLGVPDPNQAFPAKLSSLPAPIQAVRLPNGAWAGKGWLAGDVPIAKMETQITASGPLFVEATVTYAMATGKRYVMRVRVDAGSPVALVEESFDLPAAQNAATSHDQTEPTDGGKIPLVCFSLSDGLNPDTARYRGYASTADRMTVQKPDGDHEGVYTLDLAKRARQYSILGWMSWWPNAGAYYTVYRGADGDAGPVLGVMRMFSGRWVNPTGLQLWSDAGRLYLAAPLGITHKRDWEIDGIHDSEIHSDVYSGYMTPETPNDLGKRCWALYAGTKGQAQTPNGTLTAAGPNRAMVDRGEFPLDKVKDYVLSWERKPVAHPRLHTAPEQAANYPSKATAKEIDAAIASQQSYNLALLNGNGTLGLGTHFFPYMIQARGNALTADPLLASPNLTLAQRDELTTQLAFFASVLADRDFFPINTGFHIGNPNMPLALESGMALLGCVMPDHPQAARWATRGIMKISGAYDKYVHPESGAWNECPHYMYDASLYQMFEAMLALRNSGYGDLFDRPSVKRLLEYCIGIMPPPDARFGARIIPTQGNTSLEGCSIVGWAAAAYVNTDPDLSARLQWMWQEDGKLLMYNGSRDVVRPDLPAKQPVSRSTWYKGFGAILRNGFPDANETYMAYRQGPWMSHYEDGDQGSWHLYAKGAPLSLDFGSQYGPTMERPWLHNRISVDHKMDPMLEHQHDIDGFTTLGAADYVTGQAVIDTLYALSETPYHPMVQLPNAPPSAAEPIPPTTWRRSILFVKDKDLLGPNYFLVRDTFQGATKPTDWSAWCLADGVRFEGNVARFTGQYGVDLDVVALTPGQPTWVQNREAIPPPPTKARLSYGPGVPGWPKEYAEPAEDHPPIMAHNFMYLGDLWKKVNGNKVFEERQYCARMTQPAGGSYFAILYPRKRDAEPIPTYATWANGQGAKLTLPTETHYALLAPSAVQVKEGDVAMDAAVAVIRKGTARSVLSLISGRSLRLGKLDVQATAPVTVEVTKDGITGETNGPAQTIILHLPKNGAITLDGQPAGTTSGKTATIAVPAGEHRFVIK